MFPFVAKTKAIYAFMFALTTNMSFMTYASDDTSVKLHVCLSYVLLV